MTHAHDHAAHAPGHDAHGPSGAPVAALAKAGLLGGLGALIYLRFYDGTLGFYVSPSFTWLALLASFGLLALAWAQLWAAWQGWRKDGSFPLGKTTDLSPNPSPQGKGSKGQAIASRAEDAVATSPLPLGKGAGGGGRRPTGGARPRTAFSGRAFLTALPLLLPLALGWLVPPRPLASDSLATQGGPPALSAMPSAQAQPFAERALRHPSESRDLFDWAMIFSADPHPERYAGQPVELLAFVYPEASDLPADEFLAARMLMVHCAADVRPLGLAVRYPDATRYGNERWLLVRGQLAAATRGGAVQPLVVARDLIPVDPPAWPYVSPFRG